MKRTWEPPKKMALDLLAGLAAGALFWSYYRISTAKFPLNFLNIEIMVLALSGAVIGIASALKRTAIKFSLEVLLGLGLAAFAIGTLLFKDASIHFLFFGVYYEFPAPTKMFWILAGHVITAVCSPVPFFILSRWSVLHVENDGWPTPTLSLGCGLGLLAANAVIPPLGGYALLFISCGIISFFLGRKTIAAAIIAVLILGGIFLGHGKEAFFTWQLRDYRRAASFWTPYYKMDYLTYDQDQCLGAVHNTILAWSVCRDPEKQMLIYKRLSQALAGGDLPARRVLTVGRAEGAFPISMKLNNPRLERLLTVDYDPVITADLHGSFARYNGGIFLQNGIESRAEDIRFFLEQEQDRYDVLYINGAGIMLFFYPLTLLAQEDYLYSSNNYRHIFDDILTRDGVLVIDRGTNTVSEAYLLAGSLPPGVNVKFFWTKLADLPFTGLPLLYVLASRNQADLDRLARELTAGNIFTEVPCDPRLMAEYSHTDDRPIMKSIAYKLAFLLPIPLLIYLFVLFLLHYRSIAFDHPTPSTASMVADAAWVAGTVLLLVVIGVWVKTLASRNYVIGALMLAPMALYLFLLYRRLRRRMFAARTADAPSGFPSKSWMFFFFGILNAAVWLWITERGARGFSAGAPFGFTLVTALFMFGAAGGMLTRRQTAELTRQQKLIPLLVLAATFGISLLKPFSTPVAVFIAFLSGAASTLCLPPALASGARKEMIYFPALGWLVGILIFQSALASMGFIMLAVAIIAGWAGMTWRSSRLAPWKEKTSL